MTPRRSAAQPATYFDANTADGVPVDGKPDNVAEQPVSPWREIEFIEGRAVLLAGEMEQGGHARAYYKDDATSDAADTGDHLSFADNGLVADNFEEVNHGGWTDELVVVPVGRSVTAAQLAENRAQPLRIESNAAAVPTPTEGPSPTPLPSPTPRPTATMLPEPPDLYLPVAQKQHDCRTRRLRYSDASRRCGDTLTPPWSPGGGERSLPPRYSR